MKTLNVILDFNNLAMRALFTCQYMGEAKINNFDTEEECNILARKITLDICHVMNTFSPDRIIMACDVKYPWRHELYKEIDGQSYKGNRTKDEEKNWTNIFATFDDVRNILSERGVIMSQVNRAEADDVAAMWKEKLFCENKENVILVSSDKDWTQLVEFNPTSSCFCMCYNPISNNKGKKNLYMSESTAKWLNQEDKVDIFFTNYNHSKANLNRAIEGDPKIDKVVMSPEQVILEKVMCGDDGDNVPTFFEYYKNGKKMRVTPLKAKHVFEALEIKDVIDLVESVNNNSLKGALEKEMRYEMDIDFGERLLRQRKLVELKSEFFPEDVISSFRLHVVDVEGQGYTSNIPRTMQDMLENTKYITKDYKKLKENSIFATLNLDKYSKQPGLF